MVYALFCNVNFVVGSDCYHTFMFRIKGKENYDILNNNKLVEMM